MEKALKRILLSGLVILLTANISFSQTRDHLVGVTYRTSDLQLCNGDLSDFYKQYVASFATDETFFENLHIIKVKSKKSFYLLAKEQNSNRVYAFPLLRHGNGLYLNTREHVHITTKSETVLASLLQNEDARLNCSDCIETVVASAR